MTAKRFEKEAARRLLMLEGNMWSVLVSIAFPLVVYNSISQIFGFFDTLIASNMGADIVSCVSFISQIQSMFTAVATGLAIGGGVLVARFFGAGDTVSIGRCINTLVLFSFATAGFVILAIVPFAGPILRFLSMPDELVGIATAPFRLDTLAIVPLFINTIWFAVEKAKGNTKIILWCNILLLAVKFGLTLLFVYVFHGGILTLSLATFCANASVSLIALHDLTARDNPYRLSLRKKDFSAQTLIRILTLSVPVFLEKFAFSFGKVTVNSMCAAWGSTVIGALGVSNRIGGLATQPPAGVQEASASLISQNLGADRENRSLGFFWRSLAINVALGTFFFILMGICMEPVIHLFAKGNPVFAEEIRKIYTYERDANIPLAAASASMGLLYGYGFTKTAMVLNILRLFAFRIPPLWFISNFTGLGSEGVGLAMLISNDLFGIAATGTAVFIVLRRAARNRKAGPGVHAG